MLEDLHKYNYKTSNMIDDLEKNFPVISRTDLKKIFNLEKPEKAKQNVTKAILELRTKIQEFLKLKYSNPQHSYGFFDDLFIFKNNIVDISSTDFVLLKNDYSIYLTLSVIPESVNINKLLALLSNTSDSETQTLIFQTIIKKQANTPVSFDFGKNLVTQVIKHLTNSTVKFCWKNDAILENLSKITVQKQDKTTIHLFDSDFIPNEQLLQFQKNQPLLFRFLIRNNFDYLKDERILNTIIKDHKNNGRYIILLSDSLQYHPGTTLDDVDEIFQKLLTDKQKRIFCLALFNYSIYFRIIILKILLKHEYCFDDETIRTNFLRINNSYSSVDDQYGLLEDRREADALLEEYVDLCCEKSESLRKSLNYSLGDEDSHEHK